MGGVISNQNDVYAPMWNPAGLTEVESDWQGAAMHAEYFESICEIRLYFFRQSALILKMAFWEFLL